MTVRLRMRRQPAGFPPQIVQEGIVGLWQTGVFSHEEIAAITGCHASQVATVLDLVRAHIGRGLRD
ncbi:MAG: hypothetical protein CML29_17380 [Rhizobiales bacterium]|nr:hypothetical protein [Hyphomicrobiales bacterium]MBA68646.1 hypothetical protein [Hyphomicrobiales bacterium]